LALSQNRLIQTTLHTRIIRKIINTLRVSGQPAQVRRQDLQVAQVDRVEQPPWADSPELLQIKQRTPAAYMLQLELIAKIEAVSCTKRLAVRAL
jgi:hypothetical protein